ncbi:MAG: T9SS type A sorting domain-containing protein [Saprospiraceae bacterium]
MQQRVQMNAQYTVVVPTGSTVVMAEKHMPLQSNQNYNGTIPMEWQLGSVVVSPGSKPESDFYSIVPTLAPTSFYNNLVPNDTVALFSLAISPITDCGKGVRLFDNENDPGPLAVGMNGSNFSNGFTMGGIQNKYFGNDNPKGPQRPHITSLQKSCTSGLELSVSASPAQTQCQKSVEYLWKGPEGFESDQPNVHMPNAGPLQNGKYYITVKDSLGCSVIDSIIAYAKPDAGKNQFVRCYLSGSSTLKAKDSGLWSLHPNNPGTAIFSHENQRVSVLSEFSAPGEYRAIWSNESCSDTISILVQSDCTCQIKNALEIPSVFSFCEKANQMDISGSEILDQGSYRWIYKLDEGQYITAPGNFSNKNYQTGFLSSGLHTFARIFTKVGTPICIDTSNLIYIEVSQAIDAGEDIDLFCFSTDTAFVLATGAGHWKFISNSAGFLPISQFGNPQQMFSDFTVPGNYFISWNHESCTDTLLIKANPYCGCHESDGGEDKTICAGDSLFLVGTCEVGIWQSLRSNPAGDSLSINTNGEVLVYFDESAMGEYFYTFTVFDTLIDTIKIIVHSLPVINVGEDFGYCQNSPPVLLVAGGGLAYNWSTTQTTSNILVSPSQTTTYSVTGLDQNGCEGKDSITVFILPIPQGIVPTLPIANQGDNVMIESGNWTNAQTYIWSGPNDFFSNQQNFTLENVSTSAGGLYTVTVTSEHDCSSTRSVNLQVSQIVLPVELSDFTGKYNMDKHYNVLHWLIHQSVNHHLIEIERANVDDLIFSSIGKVFTNGEIGLFDYIDKDISFGQTYIYRLRSVDYDGKIQRFGPISIQVKNQNGINIQLYPMPTYDELFISFIGQKEELLSQVEIYNNVGQRVLVHNGSFQNEKQILDISTLQSGMYRVIIYINDEMISKQMIKMD